MFAHSHTIFLPNSIQQQFVAQRPMAINTSSSPRNGMASTKPAMASCIANSSCSSSHKVNPKWDGGRSSRFSPDCNTAKRQRLEATSPFQNRDLNSQPGGLLPLRDSDGGKSLAVWKNGNRVGDPGGGASPRSTFADENRVRSSVQRPKAATERRARPTFMQRLKKRRPPMLQIPADDAEDFAIRVGDYSPATIKTSYGGFYAVATRRGDRHRHIEDFYSVCTHFMGNSDQAFFGVFDGHGGCHAAYFAATNMCDSIQMAIQASSSEHSTQTAIEEAVRVAYLSTDAAFLEKRLCSGASCATALIINSSLVVANAGDCRAVVSQCGTAIALSEDHKVSREDERIRIENLGGFVECFSGIWRLQGVLAVSRGIGDLDLKEWVIADPEIKTIEINSSTEFLILASDGLWDKVTNQEVVDIARDELKIKLPSRQNISSTKVDDGKGSGNVDSRKSDKTIHANVSHLLVDACRKLLEVAIERGSMDDTTIMLIDLQQFMKS